MAISPARVTATDLAELDAMENDALDAIENVTEPNEAERLLAKVRAVQEAQRLARLGADYEKRWGVVRLKAERKYGELVQLPGQGARTELRTSSPKLTDAERKAAKRAVEVAQVPDEVFGSFIENGKTINRSRLLRVAREAEAEQKRQEPVAEVTSSQDTTIIHGDFREVLRDIAGATIITDPPYPKEFLPLWSDLSSLADEQKCERVVAMSGQAILPQVIGALSSRLTYRWCGAYLAEGPATRVWNANVATKWKPILVFDRDGSDRPFVTQDLFKSGGDDKRHHHWGQNADGFAQIVEAFTEPGDLVVDPFLGGGTTAIVARDLGRRFIGCDIDAAAVATTRERLNG